MSILVINAGSTSLKFGLFDPDAREALVSGSIDWAGGNRQAAQLAMRRLGLNEVRSHVSVPEDRAAARCAIESVAQAGEITIIGHRVVYGGPAVQDSRLVDDEVKAAIAGFADLAPMHNPPALEAIQAAEAALPGVPQVAVFDTAFFARLPARAYLYPLPFDWFTQHGVRRIGFHGISNAYCLGRAAELLRRDPAEFRLITCHLGGGCSATAVRGGVPVSTTMGFTPLEGLMMGTRSGSLDPGVLIHLQRHGRLTVDEIDDALNHRSGLLGVSGVSADLGRIESAAREGNERAQVAFQMFADRVRSAIGSLAVGMGGLDVLVFTDRAGEGSPALRATVCQGLECLGVRLDPARNAACSPDAEIASLDSPARFLVIHTREELIIAREARRVATG